MESISDPSIGSSLAGLESQGVPQAFVWKGDWPHWWSSRWNDQYFLGDFDINFGYLDGLMVVDDKEGTRYETFDSAFSFHFSRFFSKLARPTGSITTEKWEEGMGGRSPFSQNMWRYRTWWVFGGCYGLSNPVCKCLRGSKPSNIQEWNERNWTTGCVGHHYIVRD